MPTHSFWYTCINGLELQMLQFHKVTTSVGIRKKVTINAFL